MVRLSFISSFNFQRLKRFLLFLVILLILGLSFQYVFEKKVIMATSSSPAYKIDRILYDLDKSEIPIFGSSRAEGTFIPTLLGKQFFNYGITSTGDDVLLFFLEQECKKVKSTPYILFNFDLEGFTYSLGDLNNYIMDANNKYVQELLGDSNKIYYKVPFIKYFGNYMVYFKDYLNSKMMVTKYEDKGASIEKNQLTSDKFAFLIAERRQWETEFVWDKKLQAKFNHVLTGNPDKIFIIVIPPYHKSYFEKYLNYNKVLEYLDTLSGMPNVKILNFSHLIFPDKYFFNTTHLNYEGALVFNKMLKDSLTIICK